MPAGLGRSLSVALNAQTPVPATNGGGALLRSRLVDSLNAYFLNRGLPAIEPLAVRSTVFLYSRPGSIAICIVGCVRTSISPCLWRGTSKLSHGSAFDLFCQGCPLVYSLLTPSTLTYRTCIQILIFLPTVEDVVIRTCVYLLDF